MFTSITTKFTKTLGTFGGEAAERVPRGDLQRGTVHVQQLDLAQLPAVVVPRQIKCYQLFKKTINNIYVTNY